MPDNQTTQNPSSADVTQLSARAVILALAGVLGSHGVKSSEYAYVLAAAMVFAATWAWSYLQKRMSVNQRQELQQQTQLLEQAVITAMSMPADGLSALKSKMASEGEPVNRINMLANVPLATDKPS